MEQNPIIECKISVRQLVEFVLKKGSIDNRFGGRINRIKAPGFTGFCRSERENAINRKYR